MGPGPEASQNCKSLRVMIWMMCNSAVQVAAGRADHHSRLCLCHLGADQISGAILSIRSQSTGPPLQLKLKLQRLAAPLKYSICLLLAA